MADNKKALQTTNVVNVVGTLVKSTLKTDTSKNTGAEYIKGDLVLRTEDGSEHEIGFFSNKYKKDNSENAMYKGLVTLMESARSLEEVENPQEADVIKVEKCKFTIDDYVSKQDGLVKSIMKIQGTFANRLTEKEIEITPKVASFEVEGMIGKMEAEMIRGEATGNGIVILNVVDYKDDIHPLKLKVTSEMMKPFSSAGFFDGGTAKFNGKIVNTMVNEQVVEKQTFGADLVKTITITNRLNEILGGSPNIKLPITEEEYQTLLSKRRLKLAELVDGKKEDSTAQQPKTDNPFGSAPANTNPFA